MKIVFVGDSLVSCTNVALAATWPEIAAKKLGFTACLLYTSDAADE